MKSMFFIKKLSVVLCMFFASAFCFAKQKRGEQELVPAGSWIYDNLAAVALESGRADLSDQAPLPVKEIRMFLEEADYDSLSDNAKLLYDEVDRYINEELFSCGFDDLYFLADPVINLEGQYKSNDALEWAFDRYKRSEFISFPASLNVQNHLTMYTDLTFRMNKGAMSHNDVYTNIPFNLDDVDVNFPDTGYISTGCALGERSFLNFRLGMGAQDVGRTSTGSVIFSRYMTGASWADLELYSPNLRYDMNVTQFNVDKYMYSHRIDVRFFKKLTVTAMESILVNAPLELRFLNPFTIFHGMSPWKDYDPDDDETHTGAYMCFKVSYVPVKNLRLYALFAQDQFQTPYELENWPNDVTPNAIGAQAGIESFIPYGEGNFHIWLEGYYAQPYLYIKESPNWSFLRTYEENIGDMAVFYEWIGSPFGPDSVAGELNFGYEKGRKWSLTGTYLFMARGEMAKDRVFKKDGMKWGGCDTDFDYKDDEELKAWAYPDKGAQGFDEAKRRQSLVTPTGTPEYVNRVSLRGSYALSDYLTLKGQLAYTFVFNHANTKGSFEHGIEGAFTASWRFLGMNF